MAKILSLVFFLAVAVFGIGSAQAMPLMPLDQTQPGLTIQVAGGCGAGWHRGPRGGCRRNGWYAGRYWGGGPIVAPAPLVGPGPGPCFGRGWHRTCNGYGRCWRVCN